MELVVDANILFSDLIKDSFIANLIFNKNLVLYTPEFIIDEFFKYKNYILNKTSRSEEDYIKISHMLKYKINVIPKEEYKEFIDDAEKISPDEKDIIYFALALKLNCAIWSGDKKIKEQDRIKIYSTEELTKLIKK